MISHYIRCALTTEIRKVIIKNALNPERNLRTTAAVCLPPEQPGLVYAAPLRRRIRATKLLSLTSSGVAGAMLPAALQQIAGASVPLACATAAVSAAFLATPLALHWVTRRYVLSLTFDAETGVFSAATFDLLSREVTTTFTAADVSVPDVPGFLSSFEVRGRPLFVDSRMVQDPDAYAHMMGYDQPLDLKTSKEKATD